MTTTTAVLPRDSQTSQIISPTELRDVIKSGLLSFPVTPFTAEDKVNTNTFAAHLEWLAEYAIAGLIVAGGTGEFFSLAPQEVVEIVKTTRAACPNEPVIAGCGYGTRMAVDLAKAVEAAGGDGLLLLPHYLIGAPQDGIEAHIRTVCNSTSLGIIVYNRGQSVVSADTLARLTRDCPNLIGFKDGTGDIDTVRRITINNGDRLAYIGGMPTHELFAQAMRGAGVDTYSSAVFNFVPKIAMDFHAAFKAGDDAACEHLLRKFYYPFAAIRDRKTGYAVSAIKAGVRLRGFETGHTRPPLTDLTEQEHTMLQDLIAQVS